MIINGKKIKCIQERDPASLPWEEMGVDIVFECTGLFTNRVDAEKHLHAGAKKVLISAPAKDEDITVVYGVNSDQVEDHHKIVSNASCTTNCLAPVAHAIHQKIGIESGFMTTIHSYTGDQRVVDTMHKDLHRARAAAMNMIPTSTGAAKAVGKVIPALKGKLDGMASRVPVPDGSVVDLIVEVEKDVTVEDVHAAVRIAAKTKRLENILLYSEDKVVSSDIVGNSYSSIYDPEYTKVLGKRIVKTLNWYDNEWGYSNRVVDLITILKDFED